MGRKTYKFEVSSSITQLQWHLDFIQTQTNIKLKQQVQANTLIDIKYYILFMF